MCASGLWKAERLLVTLVVALAWGQATRADTVGNAIVPGPVGKLIVDASRGPLLPGDTVQTGTPVQVSLTASVRNPPPVSNDPYSINNVQGPFWVRAGASTGWAISADYAATKDAPYTPVPPPYPPMGAPPSPPPGSFGPGAPSSYGMMIAQPSTAKADATLTFTPLLAGYWKITAKPRAEYQTGGVLSFEGEGETSFVLYVALQPPPPPLNLTLTLSACPQSPIAINGGHNKDTFIIQTGDCEVLLGWKVQISVPAKKEATRWEYRSKPAGKWIEWKEAKGKNPLKWTSEAMGTSEIRAVSGAQFSDVRTVVEGDVDRAKLKFKFETPAKEVYKLKGKYYVVKPEDVPLRVTGNAPLAEKSPPLTKFSSGIIQSIKGKVIGQLDWAPPAKWSPGTVNGTKVNFPTVLKFPNVGAEKSDTIQKNGIYSDYLAVPLGSDFVLEDTPGPPRLPFMRDFNSALLGVGLTANFEYLQHQQTDLIFQDWLVVFHDETKRAQPAGR